MVLSDIPSIPIHPTPLSQSQKLLNVAFLNSLHFLSFYDAFIDKSTLLSNFAGPTLERTACSSKGDHTSKLKSKPPSPASDVYLVNSFIAAPAFDS